jgi:hypothetical protein
MVQTRLYQLLDMHPQNNLFVYHNFPRLLIFYRNLIYMVDLNKIEDITKLTKLEKRRRLIAEFIMVNKKQSAVLMRPIFRFQLLTLYSNIS